MIQVSLNSSVCNQQLFLSVRFNIVKVQTRDTMNALFLAAFINILPSSVKINYTYTGTFVKNLTVGFLYVPGKCCNCPPGHVRDDQGKCTPREHCQCEEKSECKVQQLDQAILTLNPRPGYSHTES